MQNFNFSSELVNKVKNNWLIKENANEFARCKTDAQWCLTFVAVAYKADMELEIAKEITDIAIYYIHENRD